MPPPIRSIDQPRPIGQPRRQGVFWLLTIPFPSYQPYPVPGTSWQKGQLEMGESGYLHWQLLVALSSKGSLAVIQRLYGNVHAELSRSEAAEAYVWKEDTRIPGTQFQFGCKPINRNSPTDWDSIWNLAVAGLLLEIPSNIRVQNYRTLRQIAGDYQSPVGILREVFVFWGRTGTGKSRRAWDQAGLDAYPKDPRTKFWCGYRGQQHVVVDEFRGGIDVSHLLRWLDRYPVNVEIKGSSCALAATKIWITSNLSPNEWYADLDAETLAALRRRLVITHFL